MKLNFSCKKCISFLLFLSPSLPIYYKYLPLFPCYFVFLHNQLVYYQLVYSPTRPLVTLSSSTINLFTCLLVYLSTRPLVTLSFFTINLFTRPPVHLSTRPQECIIYVISLLSYCLFVFFY